MQLHLNLNFKGHHFLTTYSTIWIKPIGFRFIGRNWALAHQVPGGFFHYPNEGQERSRIWCSQMDLYDTILNAWSPEKYPGVA